MASDVTHERIEDPSQLRAGEAEQALLLLIKYWGLALIRRTNSTLGTVRLTLEDVQTDSTLHWRNP